eukprot:6179941-Pleurochrysis_carterae.AAC.3
MGREQLPSSGRVKAGTASTWFCASVGWCASGVVTFLPWSTLLDACGCRVHSWPRNSTKSRLTSCRRAISAINASTFAVVEIVERCYPRAARPLSACMTEALKLEL